MAGSGAPASHVVCRSVCTFEEDDSQIKFDEAARRLVLIRHREFLALPLQPLGAAPGSGDHGGVVRCENRGKVDNVRFSLTHRFVAVQRSDTTLELIDLLHGNTFTHACRGGGSKARWRILGFQWTGTPVSDFLVVTSAGVEFYLVLPERRALKLVKTVQHTVSWCVYSHETRLLLLATGAQDNVIHGIQVQPTAIVRIPKFEVQLAPAAGAPPKSRRSLQPSELCAARLYNMIFCVHIEPERQQVLLYQLFKDFVVRKFALNLYSRQVAVSVVDNLLLVHSLDSHVVLLFDIKINAQYPITAPLPLGIRASDGWGELYSPHWSLGAPCFVVDPQVGVVGQLTLDLHAIARSSIDKSCLMHFLLARAGACDAILDVLARAIDEQESLGVFSRMLDLINASVAHGALRRKAYAATPPTLGAPGAPSAAALAPSARMSFDALLRSPRGAPPTAAAAAAAAPGAAAGAPPGTPSTPRTPATPAAAAVPPPPPASALEGGAEGGEAEAEAGAGGGGADAAGGALADAAATPRPPGASGERPTSAAAGGPSAGAAVGVGAAADEAEPSAGAPSAEEAPAQTSAPSSRQVRERVFLPAVAALPAAPDPRCPRRRYLIAAVTEMLHSQQQHALPPDHDVGALLLALLAQQRSFYQLHQFVQYHVVADSPTLAAQLLDLEPQYPPAAELAMDMLKRLGASANDQIMQHLLAQGELLAACRFIRHQRLLAYPARPLLAAAAATGSAATFAAVFSFFQQRNEVWRGSPAFLPEEGCDEFVRKWKEGNEGPHGAGAGSEAPVFTALGPSQMRPGEVPR